MGQEPFDRRRAGAGEGAPFGLVVVGQAQGEPFLCKVAPDAAELFPEVIHGVDAELLDDRALNILPGFDKSGGGDILGVGRRSSWRRCSSAAAATQASRHYRPRRRCCWPGR